MKRIKGHCKSLDLFIFDFIKKYMMRIHHTYDVYVNNIV